MAVIRIDRVIRSRRRTLALEIGRDASLIVRAPMRVSMREIERAVFARRFWIGKKQRIARDRKSRIPLRRFAEGDGFLYLGKSYPLSVAENAARPLSFDGGFRLDRRYLPSAKKLFTEWYRKEAYTKIKQRLDLYAGYMRLKYRKFGISNAKRRWGSCTALGNIYISWRLLMAPEEIIDYVVAHELAHLAEKNHSKRFWSRLGTIIPDCRKRRKWLRENGYLLVLD